MDQYWKRVEEAIRSMLKGETTRPVVDGLLTSAMAQDPARYHAVLRNLVGMLKGDED